MQKELLISLRGISTINNNSNATVASATLNYISFLRQVSLSAKNLEAIVSAMAPCPWSYLEIAQKLCKCEIKNDVYFRWVQFYSSNESQQQVKELKSILSGLYNRAEDITKMTMKQHFVAACKCEYGFWEAAYNAE